MIESSQAGFRSIESASYLTSENQQSLTFMIRKHRLFVFKKLKLRYEGVCKYISVLL